MPKNISTPVIAIVTPTAERIPTAAQKTIGLSSRCAACRFLSASSLPAVRLLG
jgi:hypothetical protein